METPKRAAVAPTVWCRFAQKIFAGSQAKGKSRSVFSF